MLKFARKYVGKFHFEVDLAVAEAGWLPYPDGTFDWALSVATYHHIKGEEERLKALQELRRVLRSGGEAFITVWNRRQPRFWFRGKEIAVPWRAKDRTLYRDYYLFSYGELEKLAKQAGLKILKSFPENAYRFPLKYFSRNICLLVQKGD